MSIIDFLISIVVARNEKHRNIPIQGEEVLSIISLKDEVDQVKKKRQAVQEKLRRMAKAYIDGVFPDEEYHRQKKLLEMKLESLVVPKANAAEEAGKLIMDLPRLWEKANQEEKRKLLLTMLDAVYVDAKKSKSIVAIKPKPPFKPVFQVAASRKDSNIRILNEPLNGSSVFLVKTDIAEQLSDTILSPDRFPEGLVKIVRSY